MLPTWMIEKLEQDRRAREERARPHLDLELHAPGRAAPPEDDAHERERGVVTIEMT